MERMTRTARRHRKGLARLGAAACGPIVAGLLVVGGAVVASQEPALPSGRQLIARHVAAIGGEAAYKAVKSMRLRGQLEIAAQGISARFETVAARPARLRLHVDIPGMGPSEEGYDGKVGWMIDPQLGPKLLADRELTELASDAEFDSTLHLPGFVKDLTTLGKADFDGRPAYKARVQMISGLEQVEYFDVERGFELGWEATRATALGVIPTSSFLRDYKKFGALTQPTTIVQKALFVEQVLHVTSLEYDVVSDGAFAMPPEIKALIK
jgi:hypothetical protein